jgi:hypothetical protein
VLPNPWDAGSARMLQRRVNGGEKMHRRGGAKMHQMG